MSSNLELKNSNDVQVLKRRRTLADVLWIQYTERQLTKLRSKEGCDREKRRARRLLFTPPSPTRYCCQSKWSCYYLDFLSLSELLLFFSATTMPPLLASSAVCGSVWSSHRQRWRDYGRRNRSNLCVFSDCDGGRANFIMTRDGDGVRKNS